MTDRAKADDVSTGVKIIRGVTAGLIAGVFASFVMDRFQAAVSAAGGGGDGDAEPSTAKTADGIKTAITGTPVRKADQPLAGQIVHYALGTALGVAYGVAAEFRPGITTGYGSLFGLGVAATLDETVVPAVGLRSAPWKTAPTTQLYSIASHLVFGGAAELARTMVRRTLVPQD